VNAETPRRVPPALAVALVVLLLAGVAGGLYLVLHRPSVGPDLPRLGVAPAFSLVSESGKTITTADYRGTVWIADFIFTPGSGTSHSASTPSTTRRRSSPHTRATSAPTSPAGASSTARGR